MNGDSKPQGDEELSFEASVDAMAEAIERVYDMRYGDMDAIIADFQKNVDAGLLTSSAKADLAMEAPKVMAITGEKKSTTAYEKETNKEHSKIGEKPQEQQEETKRRFSLNNPTSKSEKDIPSENLDKKKKKDSKKEAKTVTVAYTINNVSTIDGVKCTFEIDMKIFYKWADEKLIGRKKDSTIDYGKEPELFDPALQIDNEKQIEEISNVTKVTNSETGEVKRTVTLKGTAFLLSMHLKTFPFDSQNLQVCLKPHKLAKSSLILTPAPTEECAMAHHVTHEWNILGHCIKIFDSDPAASSTGKVYSTLLITVLARRRYGWFIANVFLSTAAFLLLSWATFLYDDEDLGTKNDVSMATMLTAIANKYVVSDQIPKVDYRTLLDLYVDVCFLLQVITLFMSTLVFNGAHIPLVGQYLNEAAFVVELIVVYLFHEWMLTRLINHEVDIERWLNQSQENERMQTLEASPATSPRLDGEMEPGESKSLDAPVSVGVGVSSYYSWALLQMAPMETSKSRGWRRSTKKQRGKRFSILCRMLHVLEKYEKTSSILQQWNCNIFSRSFTMLNDGSGLHGDDISEHFINFGSGLGVKLSDEARQKAEITFDTVICAIRIQRAFRKRQKERKARQSSLHMFVAIAWVTLYASLGFYCSNFLSKI
jgi:hypothetical protein